MIIPQKFLIPSKTIFKRGSVLQIAAEVKEFGESGFIIHGSSLEKSGWKRKILNSFPSCLRLETFCRGKGEPDLEEISETIKAAKRIKAQWIIGIGGGSVLDLAKAAAGLYHAKEKPLFYLGGGILEEKGIPFIAVPTTCGTGSEATINSVIINRSNNVKRSIRDEGFLARKVILDVELLKGIPSSVISYAAMDAFVQAYESFISRNATWFSETLALKSVELINSNILSAFELHEEESLSSLLLGSYLGGIALSLSRLGVIHGIAHPLGAIYGFPHGLICAVSFLPSIVLNKGVIEKKYEIMSSVIGVDFLERIKHLISALKIVSPFKGQPLKEKEKIIAETLLSGSTAANPKSINRQDVEFIIKEIFEINF